MSESLPIVERAERCETCRFWDEKLVDCIGYGVCRRYPPSGTDDLEQFDEGGCIRNALWPNTFQHDWCGEYQPIPLPVAKPKGNRQHQTEQEIAAWQALGKAARDIQKFTS